ncbi:exported protein of unknown function [Candidatus Nitrosocosmicus arcticus]|uniref:Uncharacterized protein n=2 Tax=Candidatus Nitrosocosmicus arcticus TaxID=2035267 RepID=A0A557STU6_9ARCH|nr:exported protein of unknown function [Candidatus Nitrosocosmicus arcticus]
MIMKNISLLLCVLSITSILYAYPLSVSPAQSQSGGGLEITPTVQWRENLEGTFSYCVYEGAVTLDSVNDPRAFCIVPASDSSFQNMQTSVNDNIDTYVLDQIEALPGLFKDGAPYSVCIVFAPFSPQDAGFNTAESCQQFTNKKGSHPEEPFINLDDGVLFTNSP